MPGRSMFGVRISLRVKSHVVPAQIVGQDNQDIRARWRSLRASGKASRG